MSSSDESDDDCSFAHWNSWSSDVSNGEKSSLSKENDIEKNASTNKSKMRANILKSQNSDKFGSWIPPNNWKNKNFKSLQIKKVTCRKDNKQDMAEALSAVSCSSSILDEEKNNGFDWNNRRQFLDLNNLSEENCTWNLVKPGVFHKICLWLNDYGNICGAAQGRVSAPGCKEGAVLVIDKPDLLQKLLGVTTSQWSVLCDIVKQHKLHLNYDAYNDYDISKLINLEKLWVLLCKRRHTLPEVRVSFCINGAMKIMKEFQVFPKLVIKDICDHEGYEIL